MKSSENNLIIIMFFFFQNKSLDQYIHCKWDKDTDDMIWWPPTLDVCNRKYQTLNLIIIGPFYLLQSTVFKQIFKDGLQLQMYPSCKASI